MLKKGFTQIFLVLGLALVVLTIPLTVRLVRERQETRKMAREDIGCGTCEKQESRNEETKVCQRYKQKEVTVNKTRRECDKVCVQYEEEKCRQEAYSCTKRVCDEYQEKCEPKSVPCKKPCVIGEKDDGRPIYGQCDDICEEEDCHLTNNCLREINVTETCYREKCNNPSCLREEETNCKQVPYTEIEDRDTGECEEWKIKKELTSVCVPDPNCLAKATEPPTPEPTAQPTNPPTTEPPATTQPTTTPEPTPTPTLQTSSCTNDQKECNDSGGYNECINGSWYSQSCPSDTTCFSGKCTTQPTEPPLPTASPAPATYKTQYMLMQEAYCQEHQAECQEIEKMQQQNVETAKTAAIVASVATPIIVGGAVTSPIWAPPAAVALSTGGSAAIDAAIAAGPAITTAGQFTFNAGAVAFAAGVGAQTGAGIYQNVISDPWSQYRGYSAEESAAALDAASSINNLGQNTANAGMAISQGVGIPLFYGGQGLQNIQNNRGTLFASDAEIRGGGTYNASGGQRLIINPNKDPILMNYTDRAMTNLEQERTSSGMSRMPILTKFVNQTIVHPGEIGETNPAQEALLRAQRQQIYNSGGGTATLGQFCQAGLGVCREQAAALHVIAAEANIESQMVTGKTQIITNNIQMGHAWIEFISGTGKKMVADPTYNFVKPVNEAYSYYQELFGGISNIQKQQFVKP